MLSDSTTSIPTMDRPTKSLDDEHKEKLDKMCKSCSAEQIRHMGNHLHNQADKLEKHAKKKVTMDDYEKAKKKEETY